MYPITEAVRALFEAEHRKVLRITGTDRNGTSISITDDNVMEDSFQIDRYSCNGEKLEVGTAIAAQCSFSLENIDGTYDDVVLEGTELFVEVGVADWNQASPVVTWVPCGYYTPDEQPRRMSTISITALDRMTKFDVVVDAADLTFPATIAGLVSQVCTLCGVTLAQSISALVNANVAVTALPSGQTEITYRNLIQWCAGIMGTNAWFDWNGQLRFSWYNNVTGYVSTMDNRYSSDLFENDLTVTGVEYTNDSGIAIVEGTDDYAVDLTGNAIAGPLIATVLPTLNTALNGFTYRPFTAAAVNAPYLWPMDAVTFTDKNGNNHTSALTNVAFGLNGTTALESKGMTYAINKAAQPKGFTREQAQLISQVAQNIETNIDDNLTQQEIFNRLTDNGAAQGLVLYNGQLYVNASYINAGRMNVGRIDFNEPESYYDVPDENDPDSLLSGQTVADGWIVNTSGSGNITVFSCGFAIPLRGKTVTVTFAFNGNLNGGYDSWTSISDTANTMGGGHRWRSPSSGTPSNPYTYSVVVPDDAMSFRIAMECAGVKQIEVSLDSPVTPSESIVYNYEGLRLGEGNTKFQVYRDGTLITTGKSLFNDPVRMNWLYLNTPLDVASGGTGARNAAGARANLEITPANIGAVATNLTTIDDCDDNTLTGNGGQIHFYRTDGNTLNTPYKQGLTSNSESVLFVFGNANYTTQISYTVSGTVVYIRTKAGSGSTWNGKAWTASITGVKGNAESSYRTGNVNLTPANIGAVAKSGDTMTGSLTIDHSVEPEVILRNTTTGVGVILDNAPSGNHGVWSRGYWNGSSFVSSGKWLIYRNSAGNTIVNGNAENVTGTVAVGHGGTGATNAADARTNLGITPANIGASILLTSTYTTANLLYNKLKDLEANYPVSIRISADSMRSLTGKSLTDGYGTVVKQRVENDTLVLSFDICYVDGSYRYAFTTLVSQNTITPGTVYRYTSTAMS